MPNLSVFEIVELCENRARIQQDVNDLANFWIDNLVSAQKQAAAHDTRSEGEKPGNTAIQDASSERGWESASTQSGPQLNPPKDEEQDDGAITQDYDPQHGYCFGGLS